MGQRSAAGFEGGSDGSVSPDSQELDDAEERGWRYGGSREDGGDSGNYANGDGDSDGGRSGSGTFSRTEHGGSGGGGGGGGGDGDGAWIRRRGDDRRDVIAKGSGPLPLHLSTPDPRYSAAPALNRSAGKEASSVTIAYGDERRRRRPPRRLDSGRGGRSVLESGRCLSRPEQPLRGNGRSGSGQKEEETDAAMSLDLSDCSDEVKVKIDNQLGFFPSKKAAPVARGGVHLVDVFSFGML